MSKELTTQRLTLVPVCETDAEVILTLASDRESISDFHPVFTGSEDLRSWIRARNGTDAWSWTVRLDDHVIGFIGVDRKDDVSAQVGYFIGEDFQGYGFATEALGEIVEYLMCETDIQSISAGMMVSNRASRRVAEKVGFYLEGVDVTDPFAGDGVLENAIYALERTTQVEDEAPLELVNKIAGD